MRKAPMRILWSLGAVVILGICWLGIHKAYAHCDSLDGPLLLEAKAALAKGDVTPLLKWVPPAHEAEIRNVFALVISVRKMGRDAGELADRFFFETLVRIHRAGEGAPYTGLKPAGTTVPAIVAADEALAAGSVDALSAKIGNAVRDGIRKRFVAATEKKKHVNDSVEAGRQYVAAYVEYVHFIEGIHTMVAKGAAHAHGETHVEQ